ncbi:hypothetical protein J6590_081458 [Homalodisca vitripennis]|nr:hypothetical protein J6590_081458 [Homalodisca vitripennis]
MRAISLRRSSRNDEEYCRSLDIGVTFSRWNQNRDIGIDIVQLPPENVDEVSDQEEINEDDIDDTLPQDIPENVELHSNINKTTTETEHCVVGAAASVHDELETVFDDEIHE